MVVVVMVVEFVGWKRIWKFFLFFLVVELFVGSLVVDKNFVPFSFRKKKIPFGIA
jgi:hypothetical protein